MSVLKLLAGTSWGIYNKDLARNIGLEEAIIIGELAGEYDYWLKQKGLDKEGYFYTTIDNIAKATTISEFKQRKIFKKLKDLGLMDFKLKGLPAKRYVKLNEEVIRDFIIKEPADIANNASPVVSKEQEQLRTSSVISKELDPEELQPNNNKDNNNKDHYLSDNGVSEKPLITNKSLNNNSLANNDIKSLDKKKPLDDLENMTSLDIELNYPKTQNQRILLAYINKAISSKKIIEELTEWLQLSYLHKRPLYLSGLMNQLKLLNGFSEEEIISIIKNCTLADKSTFKYEIEKREREKKYQSYNKQNNQPRVTEQKRTVELGNISF